MTKRVGKKTREHESRQDGGGQTTTKRADSEHSGDLSHDRACCSVPRRANDAPRPSPSISMTMSGGLGSDSTTAVYSEDVVTYADPDAAREWDRDGWGAVGLVSQVAGASDDEDEDSEWEDEEHEVRRPGPRKWCEDNATFSLPPSLTHSLPPFTPRPP